MTNAHKHFTSKQARLLSERAFAHGYPGVKLADGTDKPTYLKVAFQVFKEITGIEADSPEARTYAAWRSVGTATYLDKSSGTQVRKEIEGLPPYVYLDLKTIAQEMETKNNPEKKQLDFISAKTNPKKEYPQIPTGTKEFSREQAQKLIANESSIYYSGNKIYSAVTKEDFFKITCQSESVEKQFAAWRGYDKDHILFDRLLLEVSAAGITAQKAKQLVDAATDIQDNKLYIDGGVAGEILEGSFDHYPFFDSIHTDQGVLVLSHADVLEAWASKAKKEPKKKVSGIEPQGKAKGETQQTNEI